MPDDGLEKRVQSMDKLLFWLDLGAAQKGAGSKEVKRSRASGYFVR